MNKVSKIADINDEPQAITLLQSAVDIPFSSPILHNDTDSDSKNDSNDYSDREDDNYGTEKNIA